MVRGSMTRWGLAVLAAAAGLTGCNCGQSTVECTDVTVSFVSPTNGAQVVSPFDVEIRAADSTGVAYKYDTATLTSDNFSANGVVSDATAHFNGVQLPGGPHELTATIVKDSCTRTAKIDVTVRTETCTTPAVTAVAFPQDTSNDGILSAAELPSGTNLQVRVTAECTTGVQVQIKRGATVVGGPAAFSNGVATVTLPTLPDSDSATYDLTAELLQGAAPVGQPGAGSIRVERALPQCQNTTVAVQGPLQGGAGAMHPLLGTGVTTGVSAEFRLDGAQAMTSTPSMGMVSATWNVPKTGETTYAVELRCTDNFGNVATDTRMVRVDYLAPTVMITQPATNPDGGATQVTNSPVAVSVMTNAENGSQACAFRVQGTTRTPAGCGMVNGGVATVPVDLPLDGAYTIEVEVTDLAGNLGTGSVGIAAVLAGCGLGFTRPPACPALITAAQVNNGVYSFQTQSNVSCSGQTVRLSMQTVSADGGVGAPTGVGTGTIAGSGQANILGTVASGEYVYTAEVDNLGADAGVSRASCDVTVDLDGPVIQSPTVPTGQSFATINVAQDTQPGTAGAQRLLQFSARVPAGGRVDVCTTQAVDPDTMQQRSTSAACGPGWYVLQANVSSPASGFTFSEGQYSIKIVVVGGGTTVESLPVPLLVDVTRPCVRKVMSPWPQDTAAPMGALNLVELGTNAPRLQFQLDPACKDVDTTTLSATSPVVVRNLVSGLPTGSFNLAADASFASGTYTVDLTQGVANEQDYQFFVELTDLANNKNLYVGGATDPARHDVRIDKAAPTCDIVDPSASQTLLGQAQVPGGQFNVTVGTSSDVPMNGISVTLAGPTTTTRAITPAAPAYQASTAFNVTGTNNWTVSSTCTDVAGNPTAAMSRSLTIDLDAPTCTIVAPTNTMPYSVNQIQTTLNVTGAEGRMVTCTTNGTPLTPALLVSGGVATHLLTYPNGTQTVACSLTDAAGNAGSCSVLGVVVSSTACALNLTSTATTASGFWHNRTNTGNLTASSGTADVTANTPDCGPMKTVTLQRIVPTMGTPVSAMTNSLGNVSFAGVAIADGERWEVRIDNGAGVLTTQSFRVGLVAPAASGVQLGLSPVTTGTNLFFVAATGNRNVETMTAGYFADTNAGTNGAQFDAAVNGVTGARKFGLDGTVQLVFKGAVVSSQAVTTEPQSFTFVGSTLPHNDSGAFEVRVLDTAGNSTSVINNPAAIDVVAPGAPTVTQSLTNARAAQVTLQWAPTYDDGSTMSSGGHAGYDVRWTTSSVPSNNAMASSTDYFGSSSHQDTLSAWSASNINRMLDLPPLNTYFIGVRARDEVGNYSAFSAPTGLQNFWGGTSSSGTASLVGPSGSNFGQNISAGSLNNDAISDIVVAAPTRATNIGSVFIYFGSSSLSSQATCGLPSCQEIQPPDGAAGLFGTDVSANGDVNGDGKSDLIISQPTWTSSTTGRAFLYFGSSTAATIDTATRIEFRGMSGFSFGSTARIIKSIDADALDEVIFSSHGFGSNQGRVFIFKGRSVAAWQTLQTMNGGTVPASAADVVLDGPTPVAANGNQFGRLRFGLQSLGDLNSDGRPEFSIPISKETDGTTPVPNQLQRVYIYSGQVVGTASAPVPAAAPAVLNTLTPQLPVGTSASFDAFGRSVIGGLDVLSAAGTELVVAYPQGARIQIYANALSVAPAGTATETITGPQLFGFTIAGGDVTGDGRADLLAGEVPATFGRSWVLYQRNGVTAFDTSLGTAPNFWASELRVDTASTRFGRMNVLGDVTGEGRVDVIVGDEGLSTVQVWR